MLARDLSAFHERQLPSHHELLERLPITEPLFGPSTASLFVKVIVSILPDPLAPGSIHRACDDFNFGTRLLPTQQWIFQQCLSTWRHFPLQQGLLVQGRHATQHASAG